MGRLDVQLAQSQEEARSFMDFLLKDLMALEYMIDNGIIESNVQRIGAEQEICLLDETFRPAPLVMELLTLLQDGHFTTEHAKFNAEINIEPLLFNGKCLSAMEEQLTALLNNARKVLKTLDADLIYTGILPTITRYDLRDENLTPLPRYSLLSSIYDTMRGEPFNIRIEGTDQLITQADSTMFEGSNTSFQVQERNANSLIRAIH